MTNPHFGTADFIFVAIGIAILIALIWTGCVDIPLEVDEDDMERREELSVAQIKQTLRALYNVAEDELDFVPYYGHFHLYELWEIEKRFAETTWLAEFEYNYEHRNCAYLDQLFYAYMYGYMPGIPMFLIDIYPRDPVNFMDNFRGHLYTGVIIQPVNGANRMCLLLDHRYPFPDSRAIQELDMSIMRIGQIRMAPKIRR